MILYFRSRKDAKEEELAILKNRNEARQVRHEENTRVRDFRRKQYAAIRIQKAWRK